MIDLTKLNATIAALQAQVAATVGVEASATVLLQNFAATVKQAVADAIAADDAIDNSAIGLVNETVDGVTAQFVASAKTLGDAVAALPAPPAAAKK